MPSFKLKIMAGHPDMGVYAGGLKFGFFFFIVMLAAINTGNNLTYLVLAFLSGAVIVSWTLAALSLRGLSAVLRLPPEIFAGEESKIEFLVAKRIGIFPGLSLTFSLRTGRLRGKSDSSIGTKNSLSGFVKKFLGGWPKHDEGQSRAPAHQPYLARLPKGESRQLRGFFRFPRRGVYSINGIHAVCNFPFGLISLGKLFRHARPAAVKGRSIRWKMGPDNKDTRLSKTFPADHPDELVILPRLLPMEKVFERSAEGITAADSPLRGREGGLLNIRPFVPGDDYRQLHWKASAKLDRLMLKEFSREEGRAFWLHFNPTAFSTLPPKAEELFELAVSYAATVAFYGRSLNLKLLFSAPDLVLTDRPEEAQLGRERSKTPGKAAARTLRPTPGLNHVSRFLRYMATTVMRKSTPAEGPVVPELPAVRRGDETLVVIDPLNRAAVWGDGIVVLDCIFFRELLGQQR
jgi:hypothetical protein